MQPFIQLARVKVFNDNIYCTFILLLGAFIVLCFSFECIPVLSKEGRVARKDNVQIYEFVDCIPHILLQGGQVAFVLEKSSL